MQREDLLRLVDRMSVCGECGELFGEFVDAGGVQRVQRCGCERRASPREPLWPRHDFNAAVELCACCAATLISTGSRWSWLMCTPCQSRVMEEREEGEPLIPVSRHSIANEIVYTIDGGFVPAEFTRAMGDLGRRLTHLTRWTVSVVRASLAPGAVQMPVRETSHGLANARERARRTPPFARTSRSSTTMRERRAPLGMRRDGDRESD